MPSLRVAIDARVPDGAWGGVQQVVLGLASGLGRLDDEDEFVFLGYEGGSTWLEPHLACSNATVLPEVTGDAALRFDATDTAAMADAIARIWTDEPLRSSLRERGWSRASKLSWIGLLELSGPSTERSPVAS